VLGSYDNKTYADGQASAVYRFERQRDSNPPEQRAAQRALSVCRQTGSPTVEREVSMDSCI